MPFNMRINGLKNTPSPQVMVTDESNQAPPHQAPKHQSSSSSLAKYFNRSRTSSSSSLKTATVNERDLRQNMKQGDMVEALQYNKGSLLSPKMSQSSTHSGSSQKSFFGLLHKRTHESTTSPGTSEGTLVGKELNMKNRNSSKLELKRFFKNVVKPASPAKDHNVGLSQIKDTVNHMKHHPHKNHQNRTHNHHTRNRVQSEDDAIKPNQVQQAQPKTPDKMYFGAETSQELIGKYGVPGRILGEGAGGSVAIVERPSDGRIFAVKQFRPKSAKESEYDYKKKVQSEFFVGSTLHHQNIIETIDILAENLKIFVVMEYCPYDFFTIVMSGMLEKHEIACYFKQIVNGVKYLHSMGLAHRDLKLDNCVVTGDGILKLIDFGSAVVFKYPFEDELIKAKGIVGSDPYLAPEVLQLAYYDPRPVDIWSIAIIFCCMTLKRFPWKVPKISDPSYKAFIATPKQQPEISASASQADLDSLRNPDHELSTAELHELQFKTNMISNSTTTAFAPRSKTKGPYRLLRLLPHSSRPLIGAMLELQPSKRISIDGVLADEWFTTIETCHFDAENNLHRSTNHDHHLVTEEQLNDMQQEKENQKKLEDELNAR